MPCTDDFILFKKKKEREVLQRMHRDSEELREEEKKKGSVSGGKEGKDSMNFFFPSHTPVHLESMWCNTSCNLLFLEEGL